MPTVYKTFTKQELENRSITKLSASDSATLSGIIGNFVTYFKAKHLS